jgi:hypothetical protein
MRPNLGYCNAWRRLVFPMGVSGSRLGEEDEADHVIEYTFSLFLASESNSGLNGPMPAFMALHGVHSRYIS